MFSVYVITLQCIVILWFACDICKCVLIDRLIVYLFQLSFPCTDLTTAYNEFVQSLCGCLCHLWLFKFVPFTLRYNALPGWYEYQLLAALPLSTVICACNIWQQTSSIFMTESKEKEQYKQTNSNRNCQQEKCNLLTCFWKLTLIRRYMNEQLYVT